MPSLPPENTPPSSSSDLSSGALGVAKFLIRSFSTSNQRTPPPSEKKTRHVRLITISASHFCEKARWAMDLVEGDESNPFYYTEDGHPAPFQAYETLNASREMASATPMIVIDGTKKEAQEVMYDSSVIMKHFLPTLYPAQIRDEVERTEADLGRRLGAPVRCFAYWNYLSEIKKHHAGFVNLVADTRKVAIVEKIVTDNTIEKGLANGILEALSIDRETSEASLESICEVFRELSQILENNGGEYLLDTKEMAYGFTAADLTLAALTFPLLRPPEMKLWLTDLSEIPENIVRLGDKLRESAAGRHVLKLYRKHRIVKPDIVEVAMKKARRDVYPWETWFGCFTRE